MERSINNIVIFTLTTFLLVLQPIAAQGMDYKKHFSSKVLKQLIPMIWTQELSKSMVNGTSETGKEAIKNGANTHIIWMNLLEDAEAFEIEAEDYHIKHLKLYQAKVKKALEFGMIPRGHEMQVPLLSGDVEIMKQVLNTSNEINPKISPNGKTLLHAAAEIEDLNMIALLIARGANPTIKDNAGKTPIKLSGTEDVRIYLFLAAAFCATALHEPIDFESFVKKFLSSPDERKTKKFAGIFTTLTHLGRKRFVEHMYAWLKSHGYIEKDSDGYLPIQWFYLELAMRAAHTRKEQFWFHECFSYYTGKSTFEKAVEEYIKENCAGIRKQLITDDKNDILEKKRLHKQVIPDMSKPQTPNNLKLIDLKIICAGKLLSPKNAS